MDFLKFVITAVLSSAIVSAALLAIISLLTPRVRATNAKVDLYAIVDAEITMLEAEAAQDAARLKLSERSRKTSKIAV